MAAFLVGVAREIAILWMCCSRTAWKMPRIVNPSALEITYVVLGVAVLALMPATVTALKDQWLLFALGFGIPGLFLWWIAAARLARPASWWARHFYDHEKVARAKARYSRL